MQSKSLFYLQILQPSLNTIKYYNVERNIQDEEELTDKMIQKQYKSHEKKTLIALCKLVNLFCM